MRTRSWTTAIVCAATLAIGTGSAYARGGATGGATGGGGGTTTTGAVDLQVSGAASTRSPDPGSVLQFTYLVKNSGPSSATGVVVTSPVPGNVTPNYATANGSVLPCRLIGDGTTNATTYECTVGIIPKGGQATVVVNVTAPQVAQTIATSATATSNEVDARPSDNTLALSAVVKAPTGGVCKGGICDTVPTPVPAACASLTSVTAPVGYYSIWAAIWNDFTLQSCSTGPESLTVQVTETDVQTGAVIYDVVMPTALAAGQNLGYVLDNDFAPFSTTVAIAYTVRDTSGNVLATASTTATTLPAV